MLATMLYSNELKKKRPNAYEKTHEINTIGEVGFKAILFSIVVELVKQTNKQTNKKE